MRLKYDGKDETFTINVNNDSEDNDEKVKSVIEKLESYFQCVTYHYEVSSALPDLDGALTFCIPHWKIEYDYPVDRFDNFEDAKKYALERVQVLNWEKDETLE
jgi:hypothetical protein